MTAPLVRIRDLRVSLGGNPILCGVAAELQRGRVTAVIGLNGAGKTTLLRALIKEVSYEGHIEFLCGHDHRRPTPEHVGYVPQKLRIEANVPLTVLDLFGLALRRWPLFLSLFGGSLFGLAWRPWPLSLLRLDGTAFRRRVSELLAAVGVEHRLDVPAEALSGGELQRVLLALALEPKPELLLLDEPAAGIDFRMQQQFYDLIGRLNQETGVTILLVSHDLSIVGRVAHHVLCLKDGRVECQGEPKAILDGEALARTFGRETAVFLHHGHAH